MRRSGITITFILVCIAILIASYGIGLGIRGYRFRDAANQKSTPDEAKKQITQAQTPPQRRTTPPRGSDQTDRPEQRFPTRERAGDGTRDREMGRREPFENMSEEEISQRRERFGRRGRGGMGFENLSDEEIAAMEERRRQRMERFQNMTEEERAQFRRERDDRRQEDNEIDETSNDFGPGDNDIE
jgi:hypothetical protein